MAGNRLKVTTDPLTRYCHISYLIPINLPNEVAVICSWRPTKAKQWQTAKVKPFISETAERLAQATEWEQWTRLGRIIERNGAGLLRTLVFDPYPEAQSDGKVDIDFRVQILTPNKKLLTEYVEHIQVDNSDIMYIEDWSSVFQKHSVSMKPDKDNAQWHWRTNLEPSTGVTYGNELYGFAGHNKALSQLSYPLTLKGRYAIFVKAGSAKLRLTGDERSDHLSSQHGWETLWRWTTMDQQHLVIKQPHKYNGWAPASIDYVKFVPLSEELYEKLNRQFSGKPDKFIAGYWEPYSWAFHENVLETLQHREVLTAYRDARFTLVDSQVNRFGAKAVFETRMADQLLYNTRGDRRHDESIPVTDGVGKMQQFTNALNATIRYTRELGLQCHANFGASASYVGSPLQGDFSKAHPEWLYGSQLKFEVPEVRIYALNLIREALDIGAPGISIDFMRYSFTIPDVKTCNTFLRELRALVDEYSLKQERHIPVLVQFPGKGVLPRRQFRRGSWDLFDYVKWAKEGWVDYLCPSNDDERHLHLEIAPYLQAVKGTKAKVLPNVTAAGLIRPGLYLWRIRQLYNAGVDGIYIYQSDQCVQGRPMDRHCARLLASSEDVYRWWQEDTRLRPYRSKGIYITSPSRPSRGWRPRERVRVWLEGIEMGQVEMYLDGKIVNRYKEPPYLLGNEERTSDKVVPANREVELFIRARDGDGWLEQSFTLHGEKKPR
jgi:hypothetical protein